MSDLQRGETVRICGCPLRQHNGMTGRLLEYGRVSCVELDNGYRCWTAQVERISGHAKTTPATDRSQ